jgi:hypothetical protein
MSPSTESRRLPFAFAFALLDVAELEGMVSEVRGILYEVEALAKPEGSVLLDDDPAFDDAAAPEDEGKLVEGTTDVEAVPSDDTALVLEDTTLDDMTPAMHPRARSVFAQMRVVAPRTPVGRLLAFLRRAVENDMNGPSDGPTVGLLGWTAAGVSVQEGAVGNPRRGIRGCLLEALGRADGLLLVVVVVVELVALRQLSMLIRAKRRLRRRM